MNNLSQEDTQPELVLCHELLELVIQDLYQLLLHGVYDVTLIGLRNKPVSIPVRHFLDTVY